MKKDSHLFMATGGTGGHIFPSIATAEYLQTNNQKFSISYDQRCANLFPDNFAPIEKLILRDCQPCRNMLILLKNFFFIYLNCCVALIYFFRKRPKAILAFGSYAVFPILLAGTILRIPIFLHEQNTVLGSVNRLFLPVAKKIFLSSPIQTIASEKAIITGLPIREEILSKTLHTSATRNKKFKLAVIGGSQGAAIFCKIIPQAIYLLPLRYQSKIELQMQVRQELSPGISKILKNTKCSYEIKPFMDNISEIYQNSDLLVTRAGASTLAEIATIKQAAIIVPLPSAKNNHQYLNAKSIVAESALIMQKQEHFTPDWLKNMLMDFIDNPHKIKQIKESFKKKNIIHRQAVANIYTIIDRSFS